MSVQNGTRDTQLKLRIEPVPAPLWGKNLRAFMTKAEWSAYRKGLIADRGMKCETCGNSVEKRIQAHEEWQFDISTSPAIAKLSSVKLICLRCHQCEHLGSTNALMGAGKLHENTINAVISHFCIVNGVSDDVFESHKKDAFDEWERRSLLMWVVDWGEFRSLLPAKRLKEFFDPDGNPVKWLSFDHLEVRPLSSFLRDLAELSRFYGIWIGQTDKSAPLPLHFRPRCERQGNYVGERRIPMFEPVVSVPWDTLPSDTFIYGASISWELDPIGPTSMGKVPRPNLAGSQSVRTIPIK